MSSLSLSSPPFFSQAARSSNFSSSSTVQFKGCGRKSRVLSVKCLSSRPRQDAESETDEASLSSRNNSAYKWCAGLGGLGLIETAYLSYLKLTNSEAFCPTGGGTCSDVLNSDYAVVFGVPLPLIGMVAYGTVAVVGTQLAERSFPLQISESNGRLFLLGTTTSMAVASAYFLYILSTKLSGVSCTYCLASAFLSFTLFFITLKDFGLHEFQKLVGLQLCIGGLVVAALSTSYSTAQPASSRLAETDLPYFATEITTRSSPFALALAQHLHSIGATMYGAFWCSHCLEQKEMFGSEAAKLLDYVECFPNGFKKGIKIEKACSDAGIEGFPTWVIDGQVLSGEQDLSDLAEASGFKFSESSQPG